MNIFDNHLSEIQNLVLENKAIFELKNTDNLKRVNLEIPPDKFNLIYHVILPWFLANQII